MAAAAANNIINVSSSSYARASSSSSSSTSFRFFRYVFVAILTFGLTALVLMGASTLVDADGISPNNGFGPPTVRNFLLRLRRKLAKSSVFRRSSEKNTLNDPRLQKQIAPSKPPSPYYDPDPIHIVYTACGSPNEIEEDLFGLVNLKSLLMARAQLVDYNPYHKQKKPKNEEETKEQKEEEGEEGEDVDGSASPSSTSSTTTQIPSPSMIPPSYAIRRQYHVHILTNVPDAELWNQTRVNHDVYRALQRETDWITVTLHQVDSLDEAAAKAGIGDPRQVPQTMFKNCAASRLKLPFLLATQGVKKAIYMDWDTIVLCDLTTLWDEFDLFHPLALMGFAQADPTQQAEFDHYREWNLPRHPTYGSINSGVMLLHLDRMMQIKQDYWNAFASIIESKIPNATVNADYWSLTKAFPLGDQDLLNEVFHAHPDWLHIIPERYNHCLHTAEDGTMPCIIHYCGSKLMPVDKGVLSLPIQNPWKASYMFVRYWPFVSPTRPPNYAGKE